MRVKTIKSGNSLVWVVPKIYRDDLDIKSGDKFDIQDDAIKKITPRR